MAQLKWFIWITLIVIIAKMYNKSYSYKPVEANEEIEIDTIIAIPIDTINSEEHLLAMAYESVLEYYRSHYDSVESGSFTYVFKDSEGEVKMNVTFGPLISPTAKHLIISSGLANKVESKLLNATTMQVIKTIKVSDFLPYLKDINNDGSKDLIFPEQGKTIVNIYNSETGQFNKDILFEGACFSPAEKLVRGKFSNMPVYYKYRWVGFELKPVEFLYPHPENANWLIKSDSLFQDYTQAMGTTLWFLPKDYRTVEACAASGGI
jgi:hypothetical protein